MQSEQIIMLAACVAALAGCDRANKDVCQPLPAAEEGTIAAYNAAGSHPVVLEAQRREKPDPNAVFSFAGAWERSVVQTTVIHACLDRHGYLLAQGVSSSEEITNAVFVKCADIINADAELPVDLQGRTVQERVIQWAARVDARVLEARAGKCWEQ